MSRMGLRRRMAGRAEDERGAYAILVSMTLILVVALAAIAIDVAKQVESKQSLKDTMDAAAHAAVFELTGSSPTQAVAVAQQVAAKNGYAGALGARSFCVVASTGAAKQPVTSQIPGICNPGGSAPYANTKCDTSLCFIPCTPVNSNPAIKCNTIRLDASRDVDYDFAPAIGFDKGNTGAVVSVACRGACGTVAPNPLDVVVVADRTQSMSSTNRTAMVNAIQNMMLTMDPEMHFLSVGTIDKSRSVTGTACPSTARTTSGATSDSWLASAFTKNYSRRNAATGVRTLVNNSEDKSKHAINCLGASETSWGTHLAAPLKAAARRLLNLDSSNLSALSAANPRPGTPRKVIIFETDGEPNEKSETVDGMDTPSSNTLKVRQTGEPSHKHGVIACENFARVAEDVKREGILLITIGFGGAATSDCDAWNSTSGGNPEYRKCSAAAPVRSAYPSGTSGTNQYNAARAVYDAFQNKYCPVKKVRDVLAAAASDAAEGVPSRASDCSTTAGARQENTDGDYFFCSTSGSELADIFQTAFGQLSTGVKLLKMPS